MENFYSSYSNLEEGEDTLRMDQFDKHLPVGTRGSSKKRESDEDRSWQQTNTSVVIAKITSALQELDMQSCKHTKIISIYYDAEGKKQSLF